MIVYLQHIKIGNNHLDSLSSDDMEVDSDTGGIPILEELGLVSQRDEQGEQGEKQWLVASTKCNHLMVVSYLRMYSVWETAPLSSYTIEN